MFTASLILTILSRFKWFIGRFFSLFLFFACDPLILLLLLFVEFNVSLVSNTALWCCLFSMQCTYNYHSQNNWMWFFLFIEEKKTRRRRRNPKYGPWMYAFVNEEFRCDDENWWMVPLIAIITIQSILSKHFIQKHKTIFNANLPSLYWIQCFFL